MENLGLALATYTGRRVLVTGHTGFKGSWLTLWLRQIGAQVCGIALPPETTPSLFAAAGIEAQCDHRVADIRDPEALARIFAETRPEIVFHLAAQALVRRGYREPLATFASNVMGTANVLEAARQTGSVRAIVVITTDKCYENPGWPWGFRENDRLGGHDPYSASKACAEIVSSAWREAYLRQPEAALLATARAGNVIGGGDWAEDRLVPDLVRATERGEVAAIRYPAATRPWQHVLEPLAGYLMLGARLLAGERQFATAWNFGPTLADMLPVAALCDSVCHALGGQWRHEPGEHPAEAHSLRLDSSKAILELGWRPRWLLPETLEYVANWYREFLAQGNARELCLRQISAYTQAALPN